jgi:hypothetical protein
MRGWSSASVVSSSALGLLAQLALARLSVPPPAVGWSATIIVMSQAEVLEG